jgi:hypothetical protein
MTRHTTTRHVSPRRQARRPRNDAAVESLPPAIVEHPDGYYWISEGGLGEFGPFETYELAQADRDAVGDEALAPGDALQQAEREIGVADWIDAETGEPAEGASPPHLQEA